MARLRVPLNNFTYGEISPSLASRIDSSVYNQAGQSVKNVFIRAEGGVARMSSVETIQEVIDSVTIPVMAKARIGHFVEAQMLESLGIDFIDESEVLTPADDKNHIYKHDIKTPFVNGATDIGEACRRIGEGAAMIRTKGEAGTGNCLLYTSPSPRDQRGSRMPSSA